MNTEKKPIAQIITGVIIVAIVAIGSISLVNNSNRVKQLSIQNADLNSTIRLRDSLVNEMATTFEEIEQNLTFVREKRGQLYVTNSEHSAKEKKDVMVADIKLMNDMLAQNSLKIDELEQKLKSSGIEIQSFKNKIARLNTEITEQNTSIRQLTADLERRDYKIAEMNTQVIALKSENSAKADTIHMKSQVIAAKEILIETKDNELNRVYYITGTPKELLGKGVIQKDGGFLGIGRNKDITNNVDEQNFSQLDQRTAFLLPVNSKKAQLITEHPDSSYQFVYENDQIAYLQIENPAEFWKLTKYLVVEKR
jgi:outer membrane murein-binding lipoprotein Lpp